MHASSQTLVPAILFTANFVNCGGTMSCFALRAWALTLLRKKLSKECVTFVKPNPIFAPSNGCWSFQSLGHAYTIIWATLEWKLVYGLGIRRRAILTLWNALLAYYLFVLGDGTCIRKITCTHDTINTMICNIENMCSFIKDWSSTLFLYTHF